MYLPQYALCSFPFSSLETPSLVKCFAVALATGVTGAKGFFFRIGLTMVGYEVENLNGPLMHVTRVPVSKIFDLFFLTQVFAVLLVHFFRCQPFLPVRTFSGVEGAIDTSCS